jgi:hypothetical protein
MTDADAYISAEDAARLLGKSERTVYRYGKDGRIGVRDTPSGKLFHRGDVAQLARELNIEPATVEPKAELVPVGEMLAYLQQQSERHAETERMLNQAMLEIGKLQERVDQQQRLLTDLDMTRQRLAEVEAERDALQRELEQVREQSTEPKQPAAPMQHQEEIPSPDLSPRGRMLRSLLRRLGVG